MEGGGLQLPLLHMAAVAGKVGHPHATPCYTLLPCYSPLARRAACCVLRAAAAAAAAAATLTLALHYTHQVDCVLLLLQRGAPPGCRDSLGRTALMLSLDHGHTECVEALLPRASSPDLKDASGLPCLHRAAARGLSACVRLLLDAHASVDITDAEAQTPLHAACRAGEPVAALLLLEHSAAGVSVARVVCYTCYTYTCCAYTCHAYPPTAPTALTRCAAWSNLTSPAALPRCSPQEPPTAAKGMRRQHSSTASPSAFASGRTCTRHRCTMAGPCSSSPPQPAPSTY